MDTSSKFYTETEYDENGKVLAEIDETGENKTKFNYVDGTSTVCEEVLPNGSKFAYGRDYDDTVTAISQSTEDGEENSTQKVYKNGQIAEIRSGNNVVQYTYDHKRRLSSVNLNGTENYVKYEYSEETLNGKTADKVVLTNAKEEIFKSYTDKNGNLMQMDFGDTAILQYTYNVRNQLTNLVDADAGITHTYQYDTLYRLEKHTFGLYRNNRSYNAHGQVENLAFGLAADTTNDLLKYVYTYETDSKRELKGMSVAGFIEEYKTDTLGRNKKIRQTLGENTYTKQYGYYKIGDHATNRINTIMFGKNGVTDGKITYTYDEMGNVISVNENGKQTRKYEYDKLCRLIKEKVLDKDKEICYTYDNQGNILTKTVNGEATEYRYKEGTDKLISFGIETFDYDDVGNPKTFRGTEATWEKGRRLKSLQDGTNTVSYTYDGGGLRRTKTVGGVTTTYIYENGKLLREERTDNKIIDYIRGKEGVIGIRVNESNYLFRKNLFGDVTHIYNENGDIVGKYSYTAFGECTIETDVDGIASDNPFRYRGYYYDDETNLYYLKSRYYDPELGRFMTIDGIEYLNPETINGLNLYAYCGNNPVMNIDPNGNKWWNPFSWDWNAIGRVVGGVGLALVGAAITIGSLALSMVPGSGFITQAGFSTMMYGGFMVGSVFDPVIKKDMDAIGWNPFNSDPNKIVGDPAKVGEYRSQKVSFYKGMPTVWTNHSNGRSFSFLGIWLTGSNNANTIRHEWGHGIQQGILGLINYGLYIGLPSAGNWGSHKWPQRDYYRRPWEVVADYFGEVDSTTRSWYLSWTQDDLNLGIAHLIIAGLFGPFSYLFAI